MDFTGPLSYRDLRETGPRNFLVSQSFADFYLLISSLHLTYFYPYSFGTESWVQNQTISFSWY